MAHPSHQAPPPEARCATHTDVAATLVCVRCGDFACSACISPYAKSLCNRCSPRTRAASTPDAPSAVQYHPVSVPKFVILEVCSLGLYQMYWSYRCWQYIKARDHSDISPALRGFFGRVTYFWLMNDIARAGSASNKVGAQESLLTLMPESVRWLLAVGLVVSTMSQRAPWPWGAFALLSFAFVLPSVLSIQQINLAHGIKPTAWGMRTKHWAAAMFVVGLWLLIIRAAIALH
jgi:hypothetical protein